MASTTDFIETNFPKASQTVSGVITETDQYCIIDNTSVGDILEFQRDSILHYALYLGDGKVMSINVQAGKGTEALVEEHSLQGLCHDGKVCVKNHENVAQTQFQLKARSPEEIVEAAMYFKDVLVPYEIDFRNSEYYCTLWRYGKGFSTQVADQMSIRANFFERDSYGKYKHLK